MNVSPNARLSMRRAKEAEYLLISNSMTINNLNFNFNLHEISPRDDNNRVSLEYR